MPVTSTHIPKDVELAYGRNIISVFDSSGLGETIVLRIYRASDNNLIADLRQPPNAGSYAHFDVKRILQSQVSMTPDPEGTTAGTIRIFTNPNETFDYYYEVGTADSTGAVTIDTAYSSSVVDDYTVIPGRKPPANIDGTTKWYDYESYVPQVGTNVAVNNAAIPEIRHLALTDYNFDSINYNDITDGKPGTGEFPVPTEDIYRIKVYRGTDHTLQFLQRWVDGLVGGGAPPYYNGINYVRFVTFNGNTQLGDVTYSNLVSEGGGPNTTLSDQAIPLGEYGILGCKTGFNNVSLGSTSTHMYVWVECQKDDTFVFQDGTRISYAYRIDIEEGECNDFDLVQVKWLNSLGGTDYFTFQKRNTETIRVNRNEYNKTEDGWNAAGITQYSYERGRTIFSQDIREIHTATTRYLSDNESEYLKNLYMSPDVKVKFGTDVNAQWQSAILTSNTWRKRTFRTDKLFQHEIQFELANQINAQGG